MKKFESGVKYYTKGKLDLAVAFPEDDVCCQWCRFCYAEKELGRFKCRISNELIYAPEQGILENCKIKFKEN